MLRSAPGLLRLAHYRPAQPGHEFKPEAAPLPGETVIAKRACARRITPRWSSRESSPIIPSVEATVRMAGNLGFRTFLEDATFTFGRRDWNGTRRTAEEVHAISLANMHGEYCTVVRTGDLFG